MKNCIQLNLYGVSEQVHGLGLCLVSKEIMSSMPKYSLDSDFSPLNWFPCDMKTKNSVFRGMAAQRASV